MNCNLEYLKIQSKMKHNIIKNMPYFLLHDLIKYKCLTAFIRELVYFQCLFGNFNYTGENLWKYDSSSRIILGTFPWKNSLYRAEYWSNLHKIMLSNERKQKK